MEILIGRQQIQANIIRISKNQAEINGLLYNAKHNVVIPVGEDYFDVFLLYENFCQIKKKFSFSEIDLIIESKSTNFQVNFEYDNQNFSHLYISMGDFYLQQFNESDLLVFLSHELGHLMDVKNIYKSDKANFSRIKFFHLAYVSIIILFMSYLNKYNYNSHISMLIFLLINTLLSLIIKVLNRFKMAHDSRKQEYAADKYAVQVMGDLMLVLSAYEKLSIVMNDSARRSLFSSHPSLKQRILRLKIRYWYLLFWNKIFSH